MLREVGFASPVVMYVCMHVVQHVSDGQVVVFMHTVVVRRSRAPEKSILTTQTFLSLFSPSRRATGHLTQHLPRVKRHKD